MVLSARGPVRLAARGFSSAALANGRVKTRPTWLDNQSTTRMDPRVLDAMMPYFGPRFGNPHSRSHVYGWEAEDAVETARRQVAELIGANPKEIFFTSGATEANNMAIKGVAKFFKKKKHIVTVTTEHKCVLASCRALQQEGWEVTYLGVDGDGKVNLEELDAALRDGETSICSVMFGNNEIGVLQPVQEIARMCRAKGVFFHTDGAQVVGKVDVNVQELGIDLMSLSGHKLYGPKGIGALYVRRKPRVRLVPIMDGGGQERGLRSGTLPSTLCVGLGAACAIAKTELAADQRHIARLTSKLRENIFAQLQKVEINGPDNDKERVHGNLNVSFACIEGESLLMGLSKHAALSSGSACTSASLEPSYVLRALGVSEELAHTSLRFGIGRFSTEEDVDAIVEHLVGTVNRLRDMSPLWELELEGGSYSGKGDSAVQWG
jgi:cysteine desulfurase